MQNMELAAAGTVGLQYAVEGESKWGVFEKAPSSFPPSFLPAFFAWSDDG